MNPNQNPNLSPAQVPAGQPAPGASPDEYRAWLQGLPPDQQQAALQRLLQDYGMEADQMGMQYRDAAKQQAQPGMTHIGGRYATAVAANPLEHLATGGTNFMKNRKKKELEERMEQMSKDSTQAGMDVARAKFLNQSGGAGKLQQPQPPQKKNPLSWIFGNL